MANEEPALEEYWEALRGPKPKAPKKKRRQKKLEIQMTPERAGIVSQEERDRAIIARSDHLRASNYYRRRPDQEEESSEEELRQAVLNRAPHLVEWVIRSRQRTEDD
jgi:hypothetical protein